MVRSQSLYLFVNPHGQLISLFLFMTQIKKKTHNITTTRKITEFGFTASQINVKTSEKIRNKRATGLFQIKGLNF